MNIGGTKSDQKRARSHSFVQLVSPRRLPDTVKETKFLFLSFFIEEETELKV